MGANLARVLRNSFNATVMSRAVPLGLEVFAGVKQSAPPVTRLHGSLAPWTDRFRRLVREHSHNFKVASRMHKERIIDRQCVQERISLNVGENSQKVPCPHPKYPRGDIPQRHDDRPQEDDQAAR